MKNLNNFKQFNEAMKTLKDLNPNVGLFIEDYTLTLYDPKSDKLYGYISLLRSKRGWFYFPSVAAETGYGPLIFEMALMFAGENGDGLMINRDGDIRGDAFDVWKKFYSRTDVIKKTLPLSDDLFNFAIITGEQEYEDNIQKQIEYEYHLEDGHEKDIIIYNTIMNIKPSKEYQSLKDKYKNSGLDLEDISQKGNDFFNYRYNQ